MQIGAITLLEGAARQSNIVKDTSLLLTLLEIQTSLPEHSISMPCSVQ